MSSSGIFNKQFLAGFVAGGGSVYLYNKRQQSFANKVNVWDQPYRSDGDFNRKTIGNKVDEVKETVEDNYKKIYDPAKKQAEEVQNGSENVVGNMVHALKHTADYTKEQLFESDKLAEAKNKFNEAAADAEKTKNSWMNWGSKRTDEAKADYDKAVTEMKNKRDEMQANAEKKKDKWSSWGSKKYDETKGAIEDQAQQVKQGVQDTKDTISGWGNEQVENARRTGNSIKEKAEMQKSSWLSWGSKKAADVSEELDKMHERTEIELAKVNRDALSGWGENAAQLAKDEYEIATNKS